MLATRDGRARRDAHRRAGRDPRRAHAGRAAHVRRRLDRPHRPQPRRPDAAARAQGRPASDFVDLVSGVVRRVPGRHQGAVLQLVFTPDGRTAASAGRDNRILLWDVARRTIRETLVGHSERITGLAVSPDGRTLYSSGLDGKIMLWDLSGERRLGRPFALPDEAAGPALSPDGRTVAVAHSDGTVTVVELGDAADALAAGQRRARLAGVAFLRDGRLLATVPRAAGSPSGYGVEVDLASGRIGPRHAELGSPQAPSVDAGGRRMAIVQHGAALVQPLASPAVRPDAPRYYRRPRRNAERGAQRRRPQPRRRRPARASRSSTSTACGIRSFLIESATTEAPPQFSPDARLLAAGSREGWVRFWSTRTLKPLSAKLAAHSGSVLALSISRDGRTLASGGTDGTLRLFDLATRQPLGAPLPAVADGATAPVFALDGAYVFAITPPEAASAGTSAPRRGCSGHATSRAAPSPARSGTTPSRPATTPRPAPADRGRYHAGHQQCRERRRVCPVCGISRLSRDERVCGEPTRSLTCRPRRRTCACLLVARSARPGRR